jgi:hypothetical protein
MDSAEEDDPNVRFKTRFSVRRFENAMKCLTPKQRGFLIKHGYDLFLDIKFRVVFPLPFIDWIIDHIIPRLASFQLGNKRIKFDKAMIQQFIAIPSGIFIPSLCYMCSNSFLLVHGSCYYYLLLLCNALHFYF